jgi:hypothetical protein
MVQKVRNWELTSVFPAAETNSQPNARANICGNVLLQYRQIISQKVEKAQRDSRDKKESGASYCRTPAAERNVNGSRKTTVLA